MNLGLIYIYRPIQIKHQYPDRYSALERPQCTCPDMGITKALPLPQQYEKMAAFYQDLCITIAEIDRLSIEEFIERDFKTKQNHQEKLFPRGLKDHLEVDIQKLKFKPHVAAQLTTKSIRTWQTWCKEKAVKRKINSSRHQRKHYLIPFSEIEPFLKKEFVEDPRLILNYVAQRVYVTESLRLYPNPMFYDRAIACKNFPNGSKYDNALKMNENKALDWST